MIGYICSAITDFIVTFADDASIVNLHNWSRGSFSGTSWSDIRVMAALVGPVAIFTFFLSKPIGAYQLGEAYAQKHGRQYQGVPAAACSFVKFAFRLRNRLCRPISFVGIAVPHLVKQLLGTSRPLIVIPMCFLGGALFCLGCESHCPHDICAAGTFHQRVTAVFGAPVVIALMMRRRAEADT
jgi:iron complex transport system permease protein